MRICFLSTGAFAHVGAYLEHFQQAGHDVRFVALSPGPLRTVPTYNLGLGSAYSDTRGKWKYPISMLRARRLVRWLRPDIVHAHYATSGGLASLVCGFHPSIVTAHGSDLTTGVGSPVWRPLLRRIFTHADCVNTVSADLKAMAVGLGIDEAKVTVLTPGVDTFLFEEAERRPFEREGVLRLLCTRRLEPECDPLTIVGALAVLRGRRVPFQMTFAGDGCLRRKVEDLTLRLGLRSHVSFLGRVSRSEMPSLLRRHDVYLSSSRWDGTSLSLLEAMATGLFPVVSRIPANGAWIEPGVGGFLHEVGDPQDLAACILRFLQRPEIGGPAARINRAKVVEHGDRRANMRRLEATYRALTGKL